MHGIGIGPDDCNLFQSVRSGSFLTRWGVQISPLLLHFSIIKLSISLIFPLLSLILFYLSRQVHQFPLVLYPPLIKACKIIPQALFPGRLQPERGLFLEPNRSSPAGSPRNGTPRRARSGCIWGRRDPSPVSGAGN